jgi:hypothetical protein
MLNKKGIHCFVGNNVCRKDCIVQDIAGKAEKRKSIK